MNTEPVFISQKFTERFPALASRDFRLFLSGQAISVIGTMMQNTVQPYLAYRITGQPFYLGLVGFASTLPAALFTLPGGVLVERMDKRKLVIFLQGVFTVQALVMGILALTGVITIWHILVLATINGIAQAIEIPARQSMLIDLAGRKALPNAIALQSTAFNVARVVGPSLAAPILVIFSTSGEGWAFIINAISYLFVIAGLMAIGRGKPPSDPVEKAPRRSAMAEFREGQAYIRANSIIILLIVAVAAQSLLAFPIQQLLPAFARDVLSRPGDGESAVASLNALLASAQGVGALIAAAFMASFSHVKHKGWLATVGHFALGAAYLGMGLSHMVPLSMACMALAGWAGVTLYANTNTIIQLLVPNELRGRVISTYLWATQGTAPFGSLLIGTLAQGVGTSSAAVIGGGAALLIVIIINLFTNRIRKVEI